MPASSARLLLFRIADLRQLRLPDPSAVRQASRAGEGVVGHAARRVFFGIDLELRLAAITENRVAALQVFDEPLDLLPVKLDLLGSLRNGDHFFSARAGQ